MSASLLAHFGKLEEPRYAGFVSTRLPELLFWALVWTIRGAEDFEEIVLF